MWSAMYLPLGARRLGRRCGGRRGWARGCWAERPHVQFGHQRHHDRNRSRGWPPGVRVVPMLPGSPRSTACPDSRHADLLRYPTWRPGGGGIPRPTIGAFARICVVFENDKRDGAGRMGSREQRRCRNAPSTATRTASRLPRSSSTAVMLSAHCSMVGSAPDVTDRRPPCPAGRRRSSDRAMSSLRPILEATVAPEGPRST